LEESTVDTECTKSINEHGSCSQKWKRHVFYGSQCTSDN